MNDSARLCVYGTDKYDGIGKIRTVPVGIEGAMM
jgi:hypothetical protein